MATRGTRTEREMAAIRDALAQMKAKSREQRDKDLQNQYEPAQRRIPGSFSAAASARSDPGSPVSPG
jgi:hypothetical protein